MADKVLGTSSTMNAAAKNFHDDALEFDASTTNLRNTANDLQATWKGSGYQAFVSALQRWEQDMKNVGADLTNLSDGVAKSSAVFQTVDEDIRNAFAPFADF